MRCAHAYDLAIRLFGSMWFLLLAAFVGRGAIEDASAAPYHTWPQSLSRFCLVAFYLIIWLLIITRPPARAEATGVLPRVAAFAGTYMPWAITFFGRNQDATPNLLSTFCVAGGTLLMLVTLLHLGHSFSLVPQARSVVRTGPYRWVRHPLYLAEEIALLGVVLQLLSPVTIMILLAHVGVQVARMKQEEHLLRRAIPEYRASSSRWRLLPLVW
jgi:steroid 5-alpha reductase family enzyme